jgi:hypothetical protein
MRDILSPIRSRPSVPGPILACVICCAAAAAAWLSQGAIAAGTGGVRVALLPASIPALVMALVAAAAVLTAWRAGASLAPMWLIVLVALPWLPPSMPAAFLLWSGPAALLVWLAIGFSLGSSTWARLQRVGSPLDPLITGRPRLAAALLACTVYAVAAWQVAPSVPGGDEPHYLIITQSLLQDGDLKIENNHTAGDYRAYYAGDLSKPDYRRRGRNGEIYSIHAPGLPMLVAPAFALAGYRGVVVFLVLLASAGSALSWHLAWLVTKRTDAAWFGWAAVTLSTSAIFHSFTVYPDGPGGVIVLTGVWALLRADDEARSADERIGPWFAHGAVLALLPWVHTRFALIAGCLGALVLLRLGNTRNPAGKAVAFLSVPAVSALCWIGFFISIYGTPDPSFPYANEEGSARFIPGGLAGLFFDQRFGLIAYAPVLLGAFAGLAVMVRGRATRRVGLELLFILVPYLLAVTHFAMWWGGTSAPARFFVPMLPLLTIPAAVSWAAIRHRATRATALAALATTAFVSASLVFVRHGQLAYSNRQGYAAWLEWLSPATDLTRGLPAWWRGQETALYGEIAVWVVSAGLAWLVLRRFERSRWMRSRGALTAATAAAYAIAGMAAVTALWGFAGVRGNADTPGQLELLRRLGSERRPLLFEVPAMHSLTPHDLLMALRITPPLSTTPGGAGQNDWPLYQIPAVPAGRYRLQPNGERPSGWIMVGIGRDAFSIVTGPMASPPEPIVLNFPVDVRAIVVRGDEQARRSLSGITIEPLSIVAPARRIAPGTAIHAVRYDGATVYFLDDRSFPEPEAFWIGGARTSSLVIQPDIPRSSVPLVVRNGPVANRAQLRSGAWILDIPLAAGEERRVAIPADTARGATPLTVMVTGGFRPSAADPASRDTRFLGLWVRLAGLSP